MLASQVGQDKAQFNIRAVVKRTWIQEAVVDG
jgi:hypothetical protein